MPPSRSTRDAIAAALVAVALLIGLLAWPRLPEQVAIHFDASGTPDDYVSKPVGVLLLPAIMVATYALLRSSFGVEASTDPRTATVVTTATLGLCAAIQGYVVGWNLGYRVPGWLLLGGIGLWAVGLVGYVWYREHRIG